MGQLVKVSADASGRVRGGGQHPHLLASLARGDRGYLLCGVRGELQQHEGLYEGRLEEVSGPTTGQVGLRRRRSRPQS